MSNKVSIYLNNSIEESITEDIYEFFNILESTVDEYPLLNYREYNNVNSSFHKYLGVASANYGIYDQCDNGYITDSKFTPNNDSIFGKIAIDIVLNAPPNFKYLIIYCGASY